MRVRCSVGLHVTLAAASLVATPGARADLNLVPNMTPIQSAPAAVLQSICPLLNSSSVFPTLTQQQRQLALSCSKLIDTSNAQQNTSPTTLDLGLSPEELRTALQATAPEEMGAMSIVRTGTTTTSIGTRLRALRHPAAAGPRAASTVDLNGRGFALSELVGGSERGGGASADEGIASAWSGFVSGHYNWGRRDASDLESAFRFDDYGIVGGIEYRLARATVAGLALGYSTTKAEFRNGLGDVDARDLGLSVYGSHSAGNAYADGFVGFTRVKFDTSRRIVVVSATPVPGFDTTATGSTDADQVSASLGFGYDWSRGGLAVSPFARLNYLRIEVDGFSETEPLHGLGLSFASRSVTSLKSAVGVHVTQAIGMDWGVLTPYAAVEWNHEFRNRGGTIAASFVNDPFGTLFAIPTAKPDRDFYTVRLGITTVYARGVSAFANFDTVLGLSATRSSTMTVGLRMEF